MASRYWLKLYHEILHDPKMGKLSDRLWRRCIEMFLIAGDSNDDGRLPSVQDIAWALRVGVDELEQELAELERIGILSKDDDKRIVTKWAERQSASSSTERVQRFRKREQREKVRGSKYKGVKWQEPLWKDFPESPGVYVIHCLATSMSYVGATRNLRQRMQQHLSNIATGLHVMSSDFEKYGPESLTTAILALTEDETRLRDLESKYMAEYTSDDLYNIEPAKRHRNWPESEEQRERNASETIRSTDVDTEADTEEEADTEQTTFVAAASPLQALLDIGMDPDIAHELADDCDASAILGWCSELARRLRAGKKIDNPAGWVRGMLKRGIPPPAAYDNGLTNMSGT